MAAFRASISSTDGSSCRHPPATRRRNLVRLSRRKKPETEGWYYGAKWPHSRIVCATCHSIVMPHRRHFNLASAETRSVLGQPILPPRSLLASTTAKPTRVSRAELSDKLAICQQQTPPWSRSADWRSRRATNLAVSNYGPPLFVVVHRARYIRSVPGRFSFGDGRSMCVFI